MADRPTTSTPFYEIIHHGSWSQLSYRCAPDTDTTDNISQESLHPPLNHPYVPAATANNHHDTYYLTAKTIKPNDDE